MYIAAISLETYVHGDDYVHGSNYMHTGAIKKVFMYCDSAKVFVHPRFSRIFMLIIRPIINTS